MYSKYSILGVYIYRVNISPGDILVIWGNVYAYVKKTHILLVSSLVNLLVYSIQNYCNVLNSIRG